MKILIGLSLVKSMFLGLVLGLEAARNIWFRPIRDKKARILARHTNTLLSLVQILLNVKRISGCQNVWAKSLVVLKSKGIIQLCCF